MKKLILSVLTLSLVACSPKAEQKYDYQQVMPPELSDCKIFYVSDGSKGLYITRCGFDSVTTTWSRNCGKNCTTTEHTTVIENLKDARRNYE